MSQYTPSTTYNNMIFKKWIEGGGKGGGREKGEEMTQTLYAHMNKIK
jgi:hypothetical protein